MCAGARVHPAPAEQGLPVPLRSELNQVQQEPCASCRPEFVSPLRFRGHAGFPDDHAFIDVTAASRHLRLRKARILPEVVPIIS